MASTIRTNGLQHAISLGNIEVSSKSNSLHTSQRCYDSEDETMARRKGRPQSAGFYPRGSVYSKGDIREQYCLTDRQLQNSIERPRRERFFGCLSGRNAPQSFLGVCVGRRAPSDENLADYAPFYKYPRYQRQDILPYDDLDLKNNSYFQRRPASILSAPSAGLTNSKYNWTAVGQDELYLDRPRPNHPNDYDGINRGPYVLSGDQNSRNAEMSNPYLSQSTDQLVGLYRCPAHIGLPPPPPPPILANIDSTPRTKHVSFARSHTLTSFDEAAALGLRSSVRSLKNARSQERLIGGPIHGQQPQMQQPLQIQPQQSQPQPHPAHLITFNHHHPSHQHLLTQHQQHTLQQQLMLNQQQLNQQHLNQHQLNQQQLNQQQLNQQQLNQQQLSQQQLNQQQLNQQQLNQQQLNHQQLNQQQKSLSQHHSIQGLATISRPTTGILGFMVTQQHPQQHLIPATHQLHQHQSSLSPEVVVVEKIKRGTMKNQTTQTELNLRKNIQAQLNLSLSPRTIHRVKMVSQGAQTNGMLNGRKLTKSLSEMAGNRQINTITAPTNEAFLASHMDENRMTIDHEQLHRTFSEEPPRSPSMITQQPQQHYRFYEPPAPPIGGIPTHSRTSSRTSTEHPPSSIDPFSIGHSRNLSEDSSAGLPSYHSIDMSRNIIYSPYPQSINSQQSIATQAGTGMTTTTTTKSSHDYHNFPHYVLDSSMDMSHEGRLSRQSYDSHHSGQQIDFEANSLPRRTCNHYRPGEDFYSYSLPRREPYQHQEICRHATECSELLQHNYHLVSQHHSRHVPPKREISRESSTDSAGIDLERRRRASSVGIEMVPKIHFHIAYRRPSMPVAPLSHVPPQTSDQKPTYCGRSISSETDEENNVKTGDELKEAEVPCSEKDKTKRGKNVNEEKEIFIDFKPHISPMPSPRRKKKLHKTSSDGETLNDKLKDSSRDSIVIASASEEDVRIGDDDEDAKKYHYQNLPIRDEGVFDRKSDPNLLNLPVETELGVRDKREAFRKRSISLDDQNADDQAQRQLKSAPPSPCLEDGPQVQSAYPSSDSLANDITRDHSDGIWNESQVTVLTATEPCKINEPTQLLLTPSSKRKNLLLQHQQRSSIDTDGLDLEEQFSDQSLPKIPSPKLRPAATQTILAPPQQSSTHLTIPLPHTTPTIAVTPSKMEGKHRGMKTISRRSSKNLSLTGDDRLTVEPLIHIPSPQKKHESPELSSARKTSYDRNAKTNADISECSTNTDEYVTCTDNSKRTTPGIKTPPTASSSSTQVPVSAQSSQTAQEGSSFESASSLYSTRGDGLSEDNPQTDDITSTEPPEVSSLISQPTHIVVADPVITPPSTSILPGKLPHSATIGQISPSHSVSSSSSDSYILTDLTRKKASTTTIVSVLPSTTSIPQKITSPLRIHQGGVAAAIRASHLAKKKTESISDDDKSEKRYSSSGYYESPHDEDNLRLTAKQRRLRIEEERRRRKNNMKLDIERENLRALTSPIKKIVPQIKPSVKQITLSPEERNIAALNALDGTSPNKIKRFRPKIKRQQRRTSLNEMQSSATTTTTITTTLRRPKPTSKSPDKSIDRPLTKVLPSKFERKISPLKVQIEPEKLCSDNKKLKAKSIESLRSASPGSDSVFYSEADLAPEQVHCLHCGKEVEIITAVSGSHESIPTIQDEEPDIVKPPADFADSPVTTKTSQRLYKKMDRKFRSEDKHGDRGRHYRNRQENVRAKSEERGKDPTTRSPPKILRTSGSSPCVLPDEEDEHDLDQIIYRGHFNDGKYSRLTDSDVWIQLDHQSFDRQRGRRGSTDSEKSFHQKYQVILHRLIQRRCTLEMYHRQKQNSFKLISKESPQNSIRRKLEDLLRLMLIVWANEAKALKVISGKENEIDKTVYVKSDSGEFGFRIHGSKPVVVAAIEPDTPAESSGLEVGDILISVNGIPVLDKHHTEVVKIAHAGCETLELEVARTIGVLMAEQQESASPALYTGYLWRQSGQAKGSPNKKKWVKRWFTLRPDHCLYYYKTDTDTQPVGAVILTDHTVEHCSQDVGRTHAFKIDSGEGIPMFLAAESDDAANRWVAVMSHASTQSDPWMDIATRNLRLPPNGIQRPDCFGHLMKLGSRWCGWSKRYCVLSNACLYFYQDANSKNANGMACLQGYKIVAMSTNAAGRKNAFELVPPESKLRHYYFSTENEMDKKRWISALEYSIDRWIKAA